MLGLLIRNGVRSPEELHYLLRVYCGKDCWTRGHSGLSFLGGLARDRPSAPRSSAEGRQGLATERSGTTLEFSRIRGADYRQRIVGSFNKETHKKDPNL